jgi:hypothetical protein
MFATVGLIYRPTVCCVTGKKRNCSFVYIKRLFSIFIHVLHTLSLSFTRLTPTEFCCKFCYVDTYLHGHLLTFVVPLSRCSNSFYSFVFIYKILLRIWFSFNVACDVLRASVCTVHTHRLCSRYYSHFVMLYIYVYIYIYIYIFLNMQYSSTI